MPPSRPRSRVENEVGGIGILVNNAGWDRMMNFVDTDPTFWRKVNRHQSGRPPQPASCGVAAHGRAPFGPHHQHRIGCGPRRLERRGGLFSLQGRHDRLRKDYRARARAARYQGQYHLPGTDADAAFCVLRRRHARRREARGTVAAGHSAAPAGPGWASRKTIRGSSLSSPAAMPSTSPGRPFRFRAAYR